MLSLQERQVALVAAVGVWRNVRVRAPVVGRALNAVAETDRLQQVEVDDRAMQLQPRQLAAYRRRRVAVAARCAEPYRTCCRSSSTARRSRRSRCRRAGRTLGRTRQPMPASCRRSRTDESTLTQTGSLPQPGMSPWLIADLFADCAAPCRRGSCRRPCPSCSRRSRSMPGAPNVQLTALGDAVGRAADVTDDVLPSRRRHGVDEPRALLGRRTKGLLRRVARELDTAVGKLDLRAVVTAARSEADEQRRPRANFIMTGILSNCMSKKRAPSALQPRDDSLGEDRLISCVCRR